MDLIFFQVNDDAVMSLMNIFMGALVLRTKAKDQDPKPESLATADVRRNM